jgi:hypothetical protein
VAEAEGRALHRRRRQQRRAIADHHLTAAGTVGWLHHKHLLAGDRETHAVVHRVAQLHGAHEAGIGDELPAAVGLGHDLAAAAGGEAADAERVDVVVAEALQQLGGGEAVGLVAHSGGQGGGGETDRRHVLVDREHLDGGRHHALVHVEKIEPDGIHALPGAAIGGLRSHRCGAVDDLGHQGGHPEIGHRDVEQKGHIGRQPQVERFALAGGLENPQGHLAAAVVVGGGADDRQLQGDRLQLEGHRVGGGGGVLEHLQGVVGVQLHAGGQAQHGGEREAGLGGGETQVDQPPEHGGERCDHAGTGGRLELHQVDHGVAGLEFLDRLGGTHRLAGGPLAIGVLGPGAHLATGLIGGDRETGGGGTADQLPGARAGDLEFPAPGDRIGDAVGITELSGEDLAVGADAAHHHYTGGVEHGWRRWRQGGAGGVAAQADQPVVKAEGFDAQQLVHAAIHQGGDTAGTTQRIHTDLVGAAGAEVHGRVAAAATHQAVAAAAALENVVAAAAVDGVITGAAIHDVAAATGEAAVVATEQVDRFTAEAAGHVVAGVAAGGGGAGDQALAGRGAGLEAGDEQAAVIDVVAAVGDGDLDRVEGAAADDRRHDAQHPADAVVLHRQGLAGVVLEVTRRQVGGDHTEGTRRVALKQGVVHPVDDHHRRIHEQVNPFGIFIGAEDQVEADRHGRWIGDPEAKRQRCGVVRLGVKDRVDDRVDVGIAIGKAAHIGVALAEPAHAVAGAGHGAGGEQQAGTDAQRRQAAVVKADGRSG